jgi:hypothetical protein
MKFAETHIKFLKISGIVSHKFFGHQFEQSLHSLQKASQPLRSSSRITHHASRITHHALRITHTGLYHEYLFARQNFDICRAVL